MQWKAAITGKRPDHARCCGEEPDDRTPDKGEYNRNHDRRSGFGFDAVVENLDEWEAGRGLLRGM